MSTNYLFIMISKRNKFYELRQPKINIIIRIQAIFYFKYFIFRKYLFINYLIKHIQMNSLSPEEEYADDILKVKQIWKDIKNTNKSNNKKTKHSNMNKDKEKTATKKTTLISQKTISNAKNQMNQVQTIQVKTNPNMKSQPIFNQKNTSVKCNLFLQGQTSQTPNQQQVVSQIHYLKRTIEQKDHQLSLLRINNQRNLEKIKSLINKLEEKQQTIEKLKNIENQLIKNVNSLNSKQFNFDYGKIQYENFKNDSRRLLKMLQSTQQYQEFAKLALEDNGIRFLHKVNQNVKTKFDLTDKNDKRLHFCSCNKQFIAQSNFWIPQKAYNFGKQFIKDREGVLTQGQLQLLLYELNKIWRDRQKRIMNSLKAIKANQVDKYKRKIKELNKDKLQALMIQ